MSLSILDSGEKTTRNIFADRFKQICMGKTQQEVADVMGASRATISYYLNGDRSPDVARLANIATAFNVSADYLIGLTDIPEPKKIPEYIEILSAAIKHYGATMQEDVAIEEMSELTQAIMHFRRGRESNIPEEIADVEIMLEQLKIIYQCAPLTEHFKAVKIARLEERMSNND